MVVVIKWCSCCRTMVKGGDHVLVRVVASCSNGSTGIDLLVTVMVPWYGVGCW